MLILSFQHTTTRNRFIYWYHHSKEEDLRIVRKHWTKARLKSSRKNSNSYSFMSVVQGVRLFFSSSFADWNTVLSLGLVPPSSNSSLWQMSHDSVTVNILRSPMPLKLHCHSSCNCLSGITWSDKSDTCLDSETLLNCRGSSTTTWFT